MLLEAGGQEALLTVLLIVDRAGMVLEMASILKFVHQRKVGIDLTLECYCCTSPSPKLNPFLQFMFGTFEM